MDYTISDLINPISLSEFKSIYFEKKPLYISRENNRFYDHILNIESINYHLNNSDLIYPAIRLVKDANEIDPKDYTYSTTTTYNRTTDGIVDKEKLFQHFYEGNTIIFNSLERHKIQLLHLRHLLEKEFHVKGTANIYLTPKNSQGFKPHWDTHDVFILQIGGSKYWSLYDSPIRLPSKNQPFIGEWTQTKPLFNITLNEGDLLYIPRGFVHEGRATNDISLHITLGLHGTTYSDLLKLIVNDIDNEQFFRSYIPFDAPLDVDKFVKNLNAYLINTDIIKYYNEIKQNFIDQRLSDPEDRLFDYLNLDYLNDNTIIELRRSLYFSVSFSDENVILDFCNKRIKLPLFTQESIEYILKSRKFRVGDLNGNLDNKSKTILIKKLIKEGLLKISLIGNE